MEEKKTPFDYHKFMQLLLRKKWLLIIPTILFCSGAVFFAYQKPEVYESKCVLIVENSKVLSNVLSERNVQLDAGQLLQAVRERMLGWQSVTKVVKDVGLVDGLETDDMGALEKVYRTILKKINLRTKSHDFIEISYCGTNPEINFGVVNGLVSNFMEQSLKSSRSEARDTLEFIEEDLERLKGVLDNSERKFRMFEEEHINDLPGNENSVLPKFYTAKSELAGVNSDIVAIEEKLKFLENRKSAENEKITGEIIQIPNPKVEELNEQITNLEIEITMLQSKYYDEHPRIVQKQNELTYLKKLLQEESKVVVTEEKIVNNPRYESMVEKDFNLRLELSSLKSHRKEIEHTLDNFRPSVENIPELKQKLFELQMDYEINKKLYEQRLMQKSKAELVQEMSLDSKSNPFNIVEPARISYEPLKGHKIKIIVMGTILGIGLGVGLIFGLEQIDTRFKSIEEMQEYLNIPAVGMIPTIVIQSDMSRKIERARF
ncbi:MAG: Wzz/FepE/Etk N-terminal domain-containing protein [Candidatus Scalindua sp.]|nr:Wzz/FepE/Etk N-terminal domain-containing protein [Candidatus Scalindua sp.]